MRQSTHTEGRNLSITAGTLRVLCVAAGLIMAVLGCASGMKTLRAPNTESIPEARLGRLNSRMAAEKVALCPLRVTVQVAPVMTAYQKSLTGDPSPTATYMLAPVLKSAWEQVLHRVWQPAPSGCTTAFDCRVQVHSSKLTIRGGSCRYELSVFAALYSPDGKQLLGRSVAQTAESRFDGSSVPDAVADASCETAVQFCLQTLDSPMVLKLASRKAAAAPAAVAATPSPAPRVRPPSPGMGRYYVVCIGVSEYQDAELPRLAFSSKDAEDFAAFMRLKCGLNADCIRTLTDSKATKANVESALEGFLSKAGRNDVIILYWSGHGYFDPDNPKNVYFACHDTRLKKPFTGYRMDRVRSSLEEKGARNVIVLADTCHAGKIVTRDAEKGILGVVPAVRHMQESQLIPKGMAFLVAADTDRRAIESTSWSNGAFTHVLLKGLEGKADGYQGSGARDGRITLGEIRAYMNSELPNETERVLGKALHPVIAVTTGAEQINDLPIVGGTR